MSVRNISGRLFKGSNAFLLARVRRISHIELDEGGRGVDPATGHHEVGENSDDVVRTSRYLHCRPLHERVSVHSGALSFELLQITERIPEPPHGEPAIET